MTEPSQYFKGRTVQEQMNEVIGYVDVRSAEVATDAIAADVAQVHQDMLDADADAAAAAASAAAAAGVLANAVKKTGEASQSIAGDIAVAGDLSAGGDLAVTGDATAVNVRSTGTLYANNDASVGRNLGVGGSISVVDLTATGVVSVPTPTGNTHAANKKYVDDQDALKVSIAAINSYAVGLTGNQTSISGNKGFLGNIQVGDDTHPLTGGFIAVTNGAYRRIKLQNIDTNLNTAPAATVGFPIIAWTDGNDVNACTLLAQQMTDGKTRLVAQLRNADGTSKTIVLGVSD